MRLSRDQEQVLRALINGWTLKSHRYLDGRKIFQLHPLEGPPQAVAQSTVASLKRRGLIDSNKKFPAATYLLTGKGRELAEAIDKPPASPLSAKNY